MPFSNSELCFWVERFAYVTREAMCYTRVMKRRRGDGRVVDRDYTRLIRLADIQDVVGVVDARLLIVRSRRRRMLRCPRGDPYYKEELEVHHDSRPVAPAEKLHTDQFLMPTAEAVELWARSVCRLAALAGYTCEARIEVSAAGQMGDGKGGGTAGGDLRTAARFDRGGRVRLAAPDAASSAAPPTDDDDAPLRIRMTPPPPPGPASDGMLDRAQAAARELRV